MYYFSYCFQTLKKLTHFSEVEFFLVQKTLLKLNLMNNCLSQSPLHSSPDVALTRITRFYTRCKKWWQVIKKRVTGTLTFDQFNNYTKNCQILISKKNLFIEISSTVPNAINILRGCINKSVNTTSSCNLNMFMNLFT